MADQVTRLKEPQTVSFSASDGGKAFDLKNKLLGNRSLKDSDRKFIEKNEIGQMSPQNSPLQSLVLDSSESILKDRKFASRQKPLDEKQAPKPKFKQKMFPAKEGEEKEKGGAKDSKKKEEGEEPKKMEFVINPLTALQVGFLMQKNSSHRWKRRWCVLESDSLTVFKETMQKAVRIPLLGGAVKPVVDKQANFVLLTAGNTYYFSCENPKEMYRWVSAIGDVCENLILNTIQAPLEEGGPENSPSEEVVRPERAELLALMKVPGNDLCADCNTPEPEWASINLGVFICLQCSGVHRSLGSHVSKVRSIHLDDWQNEAVGVMRAVGNTRANLTWESQVPAHVSKPTLKSSREERENYIKMKYVQHSFRDREPVVPRAASVLLPSLNEQMLKYVFLQLLQTDVSFRTQVRTLICSSEEEIAEAARIEASKSSSNSDVQTPASPNGSGSGSGSGILSPPSLESQQSSPFNSPILSPVKTTKSTRSATDSTPFAPIVTPPSADSFPPPNSDPQRGTQTGANLLPSPRSHTATSQSPSIGRKFPGSSSPHCRPSSPNTSPSYRPPPLSKKSTRPSPSVGQSDSFDSNPGIITSNYLSLSPSPRQHLMVDKEIVSLIDSQSMPNLVTSNPPKKKKEKKGKVLRNPSSEASGGEETEQDGRDKSERAGSGLGLGLPERDLFHKIPSARRKKERERKVASSMKASPGGFFDDNLIRYQISPPSSPRSRRGSSNSPTDVIQPKSKRREKRDQEKEREKENREKDKERDKDREKGRDKEKEREKEKDKDKEKSKEREKDKEKEKERDKDREKGRDKEKEREREKEKDKEKSKEREKEKIVK